MASLPSIGFRLFVALLWVLLLCFFVLSAYTMPSHVLYILSVYIVQCKVYVIVNYSLNMHLCMNKLKCSGNQGSRIIKVWIIVVELYPESNTGKNLWIKKVLTFQLLCWSFYQSMLTVKNQCIYILTVVPYALCRSAVNGIHEARKGFKCCCFCCRSDFQHSEVVVVWSLLGTVAFCQSDAECFLGP